MRLQKKASQRKLCMVCEELNNIYTGFINAQKRVRRVDAELFIGVTSKEEQKDL